MRVLVCGGRDYGQRSTVDGEGKPLPPDARERMEAEYEHVHSVLSAFYCASRITHLIEGGASGADTAAREWAHASGVTVRTFPADWKKHGKAAGPIRNEYMLSEGKPDVVLAFPGGKGTAHMVKLARNAGVETVIIKEPT